MTVPAPVALAEVPALIVTPHPVSLQGQRVLSAAAAQFTPGESLASLLERQGVLPGQQWVVTIDGFEVPASMWLYTRPKHGTLIECRRVPEKDALRIIAVAALSYFTFGMGGLAGGSFVGLTGATGAFAAGAAFLAGSLVINKMLAPKMPGRGGAGDQNNSPTYSLAAGGRNRARLFEPMGLVLGEPYAVPDFAAQPYTFFAGGEQYLWQMFHLGINCADAQSLRVGQTPLNLYQGVTVLRNGLATGNSALPALGTSVDTVAGSVLEGANGHPWVTRTTSVGTVHISLDFVAQLFSVNESGAFEMRQLDVEIEYRLVGSGTWLPFTAAVAEVPPVTRVVTMPAGYYDSGDSMFYQPESSYTEVIVPAVPGVPAGTMRLFGGSQKPLRVTMDRSVAAGQYEIRVRKSSGDYTGTQGSNQIEWAQLRSYQQDLANYDGQARLAIQIQASGQLNGTLDELNAALRAKPMPCWNGSSWVTAYDRATGLCNPGAIFLLLARGIFDSSGRRLAGLGYSDSQIDIEGLKRFMVRCQAKGFEYDHFVQETLSLQDLLDAIAYAGLGEIGYPDGKLGVVFFSEDDPIEGVINMASIKARSFSVDYETMPTADEIEVQYFDRFRGNAWRSLRVMAPGVTNPRATARLQLMGVTSEAHAAVLGRFAMAQNVFQRKTVTLEQDLEYMTHRRGAVVSLSHDLTQWGYNGRLQAAQDVAGEIHLTLDERAPGAIPSGGSGRFIGLRLPGESAPRIFPVKAFVGESRAVVLDAPWPAGVPLPGSTADNPAHDTLWIYDFKATPGQRLLVAGIEPSGDGARLTLVPIGPEFWSYVFTGAYTPPPSNSLLRGAPTVTRVIPTEELARQGNTFYTELSLYFEVSGAFSQAELWGATGEGDIAPSSLRMLASGRSQSLSWRGGLDERWHLELRVTSDVHRAKPYRLIYDVRGLREPPPNVEALGVNGDTLVFPAVDVSDIAGYLVRFQYGNNPWWDSATPLHEGVITESPWLLQRRPQGLVTLLIKAVDTTGNESAEATWIVYNFPELPVENVLVGFPQHPGFSGNYTGGSVVGGELRADATDQFWEPARAPFWTPSAEPFWGTSQYGTLVYEFEVTPAHPGTLVLQYDIEGDGLLIEYQVSGTEPFWEPASAPFWEPPEALFWGTPSAWSVWPGALLFDGVGRVSFRITVAPGTEQGAIRELTAVLDVPDVTEKLGNVVVAAAGTRLPIAKSYTAISTVHLTVQGGSAGISARWLDKDPILGPLVEILNASGTAVAGVLDADIQGY